MTHAINSRRRAAPLRQTARLLVLAGLLAGATAAALAQPRDSDTRWFAIDGSACVAIETRFPDRAGKVKLLGTTRFQPGDISALQEYEGRRDVKLHNAAGREYNGRHALVTIGKDSFHFVRGAVSCSSYLLSRHKIAFY